MSIRAFVAALLVVAPICSCSSSGGSGSNTTASEGGAPSGTPATIDFCTVLTKALAAEAFGAPSKDASVRPPTEIAECKYLRDATSDPEATFEVSGGYSVASDAAKGRAEFVQSYATGGFTAVTGVGEVAYASFTTFGASTPVAFIASYQGKYRVSINANGSAAALEGVAKKVMAALPK